MEKAKTVSMFNATLQRETEHTVDIDDKGEIVLTCVETGHFVKLPADTTAKGLKAYIVAHKAANEGQVTVEAMQARKAKLLAGITGGGD